MTEKDFLNNYNIHEFDVPLSTVDMAIFSLINDVLNVLLVKREQHPHISQWALPGGFIDLKKDLTLEQAAQRKLKEKTGLNTGYLEQVETIGSNVRDPRGWSLTVVYFALVDIEQIEELDASTQWLPIHEIAQTGLAFDHEKLIELSLTRLKAKATYTALPIELMPSEFTLTELQNVFSMFLGRSLQTKSFRKRVIDAGMVEETGNSKISGKRPAKLYRSTNIDRETYFTRPLQD